MTHVEVKDGNVEGALKRFKMKVQRSGVPTEMKKRKEDPIKMKMRIKIKMVPI